MVWKPGCLISVFRCRVRCQAVIGLLCLFVLVVSGGGSPKSCGALETERVEKKHLHIAPGVFWKHVSGSRPPSENDCSCSVSLTSCCIDGSYNAPKGSHAFLRSRDDPRPISGLRPTMIRPLDLEPLGKTDGHFCNFISIDQREFFLVNCAFLI
jgi:hypothetical protein